MDLHFQGQLEQFARGQHCLLALVMLQLVLLYSCLPLVAQFHLQLQWFELLTQKLLELVQLFVRLYLDPQLVVHLHLSLNCFVLVLSQTQLELD